MYQRAARAPSVFELFQAGDQGFPQVTDPCAGTLSDGDTQQVSPEVAAFCQSAFGIDPATYSQPNSQIEAFFFGNPNLTEETSDTYTFGIAVRPESVQALQFSIDYYGIKVDDYVNILEGGTTGVVNFAYRVPFAFASGPFGDTLQVNLLVSWLDKWELDGIDYAGTIGAYNYAGAFPEYKADLRLGYQVGPVAFSYNLEFLDSMDNQGNIAAFQDPDQGEFQGVSSTLHHDLSAQWSINDSLALSLGVRNLTDEEPKFFDVPIDQNTDPSTFDTLGRFYYASLRASF